MGLLEHGSYGGLENFDCDRMFGNSLELTHGGEGLLVGCSGEDDDAVSFILRIHPWQCVQYFSIKDSRVKEEGRQQSWRLNNGIAADDSLDGGNLIVVGSEIEDDGKAPVFNLTQGKCIKVARLDGLTSAANFGN